MPAGTVSHSPSAFRASRSPSSSPSNHGAVVHLYHGWNGGAVTKVRIALKQLFEVAEYVGLIERNPA